MTRYRTIVADPPWRYGSFGVGRIPKGTEHDGRATPMPYDMMSVSEICALPVEALAEDAALGHRDRGDLIRKLYGHFEYESALERVKAAVAASDELTMRRAVA